MATPRPFSVVHVTAERGFSGGEVQVFLLMEGLRKRGHRGVLVCPPGSRAEAEAQRRGLESEAVRMPGEWALGSVLGIGRVLRASACDLVHLHSGRAVWLGALAARSTATPALATRRMDRRLRPSRRNRWLYGHALRAVAAISDPIAQQLRDAGVPAERIQVIPSAVAPDRRHGQRGRVAVRGSLEVGEDTPCILIAAALVRRKGVDVLLEALARLRDVEPAVQLWIAGDGPERDALARRASELGVADRTRFLGRRDDVPDLLAACDVFALPSRQEGLGVAALEAMVAGRALVASRVGGLADAVEDAGLLVPPDDAAALATALARLLSDAGLRARLGAAGQRRVEKRHRAETQVDAYERLYAELLA